MTIKQKERRQEFKDLESGDWFDSLNPYIGFCIKVGNQLRDKRINAVSLNGIVWNFQEDYRVAKLCNVEIEANFA